MIRRSLGALLPSAAVVACLVGIGQPDAQERTSVYVPEPAIADRHLRDRVHDSLPSFREALTAGGPVSIAADAEMDAVLSECRDQIGAEPDEERLCELQAARRAAMDHVLVIDGRRVGSAWELSLTAFDSGALEAIFGATVEFEGDTHQAVSLALVSLASRYTRSLSGESAPDQCYAPTVVREPPIDNPAIGAVLEVLGVSPGRLGVRIDGALVGHAPGQIVGLAPGSVAVELFADGYRAVERTVTLEEGEVATLVGVTLEPVSGWVVVSSNLAGVTVAIDGQPVGQVMGEAVRFELRPGGHTVEIARDGFSTVIREVDIRPGMDHPVEAWLSPVTESATEPAKDEDAALPAACGDGLVNQFWEECDDGNREGSDGCDRRCRVEDVVFWWALAGSVLGIPDHEDPVIFTFPSTFGVTVGRWVRFGLYVDLGLALNRDEDRPGSRPTGEINDDGNEERQYPQEGVTFLALVGGVAGVRLGPAFRADVIGGLHRLGPRRHRWNDKDAEDWYECAENADPVTSWAALGRLAFGEGGPREFRWEIDLLGGYSGALHSLMLGFQVSMGFGG